MHKPAIRLADVFSAGFAHYLLDNGPLPAQHYAVANAIMACRTAALGGHVLHCQECGHDVISYNSCRNRHCPTCQARARAQWVDARTRELLRVPYFHVVFTVPAQLNPFALRNKEAFYNILFAAASQTLAELGRDDKRLGGELGCIAVLHTWGQNLMDHPHLHFIVPGGALDDDRWVSCNARDFLFPVKVMAALFRGKFLDAFKHALDNGDIALCGTLERFRKDPALLRGMIDDLYRTNWVVYAKPPFGGPKAVVKYLGRYTHRIAIADARIVALTDTHVSFQWKDYADHGRSKIMTLTIVEFIRRFLYHVVPLHFVRIRYYGFLSVRSRKVKLALCRDQTGGETIDADALHTDAPTGPRWAPCAVCGSVRMVPIRMIMKYSPWRPEEINVRTARGFNHTIPPDEDGKSPRYPEPFGKTIKMVPGSISGGILALAA